MKKITFIFGIIGILLFIVLSGMAQSLTPGFNAMQTPSSNLAAGQYGLLQNAAFLTGGIGFILLGISMSVKAKRMSKIAPKLIMLWGIILCLEAVFQSNPIQTDTGTRIHIMLFMLGMIGMVAATFFVGAALRSVNGFLSFYSFLTGVVSLIGFAGIFLTRGAVGLWQQVAVGSLFLWIFITAIFTYFKQSKLT